MIQWKEEFVTGIDIIDEQHKEYIEVLNELEQYGTNKDLFLVTLMKLQSHIEMHFNSEEEYMRNYSYPHIQEHIIEHEKLLNAFVDFLQKIASENNIDLLSSKLVEFLTNFITEHYTAQDKKMTIFIKNAITK